MHAYYLEYVLFYCCTRAHPGDFFSQFFSKVHVIQVYTMLYARTYIEDGYKIPVTTESPADSTSIENTVHKTFHANGLSRYRRVHGCMWCQT